MIIDGKAIANEYLEGISRDVSRLEGRKPCMAVVLVGKDPASHVYVNLKTKACEKVGIRSQKLEFPDTLTQAELLELVYGLNNDPQVDGILIQMPLPSHINSVEVLNAINPEKDVDGFHPVNVGKLSLGDPTGFIPCTPLGIMELFNYHSIDITGLQTVIVGRSNIVGKPMSILMLAADATVTVVHRRTKNIEAITREADILIAAVGRPELITADMVKPGAVVIDVGVNKVDDPNAKKGYRLVGDVSFDAVKQKASAITPVPGGVGPMTIAMLMHNTLRSYQRQCTRSSLS